MDYLVTDQLLQKNIYPFEPTTKEDLDSRGTSVREYHILEEVLSEIAKVTISEKPPRKGVHVNIFTSLKQGSQAAKVLCGMSGLLLSLLPCYSDTFGIVVHFEVFANNLVAKTYEYELQTTKLIWLPLFPFHWVNYLVPTYEEAFRSVTHQFVHDAQADGVL